MWKIKICGITSPKDALLAAECGADAIGLNFCPASPRCIAPELARDIVRVLPSQIKAVGVFVNAWPAEILSLQSQVGLHGIQLHGDEPVELLTELTGGMSQPIPIVRALRSRRADLSDLYEYLQSCAVKSVPLAAVLLDAYHRGAYGGTGQAVDWQAVRQHRLQLCGLPLILAGGLNPENVAAAIQAAAPDGVDVASGVEISPGKKSPDLMRRFITAAQAAWK